jgi:hypothetical protein
MTGMTIGTLPPYTSAARGNGVRGTQLPVVAKTL